MLIIQLSFANGLGAIAQPQGGKKLLCEKTDDIVQCKKQRGIEQS
jgi:hypothetical protein